MNVREQTNPIDAVICWVDGSDPKWLAEKKEWEQSHPSAQTAAELKWNQGELRYRDWGLLPYFFRGIERFAPWIRTVHFVTWGHIPQWLNTRHPRLHIVRHDEYIPPRFLPTFNSHTIELNFHRISSLAEQFIYFNDDMFLTAPVKATDFFRKGLPCDSAVLNPIPMTRRIGHAEINNIGILNDHFRKNDVIRRAPFQWFNPKYGFKAFRTCLMMPWKQFVGLYEQHLPASYLKSTYETVWALEEEELNATCACKFRDRSNVNQWLFKNWQIAQGKFIPRSFRVGQMFMYGEADNYDRVCEAVGSGQWKMLCINDTEDIDDFDRRKAQLIQAFNGVLPEKSEFELE